MEFNKEDLKIYPVTKKIFDIFWKDGWDNCVRVKKTKDKLLSKLLRNHHNIC